MEILRNDVKDFFTIELRLLAFELFFVDRQRTLGKGIEL